MKRLHAGLITLFWGGILIGSAPAQQQATVRRFDPGSNTASPSQVTVSRSPIVSRTPQDFNYFYLSGRNNLYSLSPYAIVPQGGVPRLTGPSIPYTDEEYGRLILSTVEAGGVEPVISQRTGRTLLQEITGGIPGRYRTVEVRIADVADRGTLVADTNEEIRLRGIRIPSERVSDDVTRLYAREAMRLIRDLIGDETVYMAFDEPLRDSDGTILATIYLHDGTNLNRLLLEYGYGQYASDDFLPGEAPQELAAAEESARAIKTGLWSRRP